MDIMGTLYSNLDKLAAQIQSTVAEFLGCKLTLLNAKTKTKDPGFLVKINGLLSTQQELETQLPGVLQFIENAKQSLSSVSVSDTANAATFYYNITEHIKNVKTVSKSVSSAIGTPSALSDFWAKYRMWIIGAGVIWLWKR